MKEFILTLWFSACLIFCTVCVTMVVVGAKVKYECTELGRLQIANTFYACEPMQPLVNESEDFK